MACSWDTSQWKVYGSKWSYRFPSGMGHERIADSSLKTFTVRFCSIGTDGSAKAENNYGQGVIKGEVILEGEICVSHTHPHMGGGGEATAPLLSERGHFSDRRKIIALVQITTIFSILSHFPYFVFKIQSVHDSIQTRTLCTIFGLFFHRKMEKHPANDAGNPVNFMVIPYTHINPSNSIKIRVLGGSGRYSHSMMRITPIDFCPHQQWPQSLTERHHCLCSEGTTHSQL